MLCNVELLLYMWSFCVNISVTKVINNQSVVYCISCIFIWNNYVFHEFMYIFCFWWNFNSASWLMLWRHKNAKLHTTTIQTGDTCENNFLLFTTDIYSNRSQRLKVSVESMAHWQATGDMRASSVSAEISVLSEFSTAVTLPSAASAEQVGSWENEVESVLCTASDKQL